MAPTFFLPDCLSPASTNDMELSHSTQNINDLKCTQPPPQTHISIKKTMAAYYCSVFLPSQVHHVPWRQLIIVIVHALLGVLQRSGAGQQVRDYNIRPHEATCSCAGVAQAHMCIMISFLSPLIEKHWPLKHAINACVNSARDTRLEDAFEGASWPACVGL